MNETILITGGTGFVGTHLSRALVQSDASVHVTSLSGTADAPTGVTVHQVDLLDSVATERLFAELKPAQVYHLASLAAVGSSYSQAEEILTQNARLQHSVLAAIVAQVPDAKLLHVSSAEVYGVSQPEELPIAESHPFRPVNPYGVSKATQDLLTGSYIRSYGISAVIVRSFNHIGPGQSAAFALPAFAQQLVAIERGAEAVLRVGNLHAIRDFTDVEDIVKAYILLMEHGQSGQAYNLGSGVGYSMQDVLNQMVTILDTPVDIQVDPERLRPLDIPVMVANNAKISALGWTPTVPLEESLRRIIEYWRTQA